MWLHIHPLGYLLDLLPVAACSIWFVLDILSVWGLYGAFAKEASRGFLFALVVYRQSKEQIMAREGERKQTLYGHNFLWVKVKWPDGDHINLFQGHLKFCKQLFYFTSIGHILPVKRVSGYDYFLTHKENKVLWSGHDIYTLLTLQELLQKWHVKHLLMARKLEFYLYPFCLCFPIFNLWSKEKEIMMGKALRSVCLQPAVLLLTAVWYSFFHGGGRAREWDGKFRFSNICKVSHPNSTNIGYKSYCIQLLRTFLSIMICSHRDGLLDRSVVFWHCRYIGSILSQVWGLNICQNYYLSHMGLNWFIVSWCWVVYTKLIVLVPVALLGRILRIWIITDFQYMNCNC